MQTMSRVSAVLLLVFALLLGGFERGIASSKTEEIIPCLKGMTLSSADATPGPFLSSAIFIDHSLQLPGPEEELRARLSSHLERPLRFTDVDQLKETIAQFYIRYHRPFVSVVVPPQDLSSGVLQVVVIEGKVGQIHLRGNRWTSNRFLAQNVKLRTGSSIDSAHLKRNLAWLNRNPFRQTDAFFYPGTTSGTTDIDLVTTDQIPCQPFAGADNTGTALTQRTRLFGGVNAGNLWGIDHRLSYQYTLSPDGTSLGAHSGSYVVPFPWRQQLYAFGGYARSHVRLPHSLHHVAHSWQISGRYQIPLTLYGSLLQEISLGYDFKRTNNSLLFGGDFVSRKFADVNQFFLGYSLDHSARRWTTAFSLEIFGAPCEMTAHQNAQDYRAIRLFAKPRYVYGKARVSETVQLCPHLESKVLLAGQASGGNLLPSEMFGLGGYNTVRGYNERAENADNALLTSVELECFMRLINKKKIKDKLAFLGFFDYGWGKEHKATPGEKEQEWLAGAGGGIRYHLGRYLLLRADIGVPLHKVESSFYEPHLHVGMTASY